MRRSALLLPLVLGALLSPSSAEAGDLGQLARKENIVTGDFPEAEPRDMREGDPVRDTLHVGTGTKSGARFTIGRLQGALTMGPESSFRFLSSRFDSAGFVVRNLDLRIQWGIFRFSFAPPPKGVQPVLGAAPGEVRIETPTGRIQLYGTDVYMHVERQGGATTVYVAEGAVVVTGSGQELHVEKGHGAYVPPGGPPRPWDPGAGPDGGGPAVHFPEDWQPSGPLWLDLIRLDLPR